MTVNFKWGFFYDSEEGVRNTVLCSPTVIQQLNLRFLSAFCSRWTNNWTCQPLSSNVLFHVKPCVVILLIWIETSCPLSAYLQQKCQNQNNLVKGQSVSVQVGVRPQIDLMD